MKPIGNAARFLLSLAAICATVTSQAEVKVDPLVGSDLPARRGPHWVWVNDMVFHHMADGKAFLVDGDSGNMMGMLSTGFAFNGVVLSHNRASILSAETYFSRGTRGERTDVVTIYDPRKLSPIGEIVIPPKRASTLPMVQNSAVTDDDRFLLVYNFTPAQTVSVIDLSSRKLAGEIDTAGCALVYPTGPRNFFSICGDGTALVVTLNDSGAATRKNKSAKLFDPQADPVTEKAVRDQNTWLFASFAGDIVPVEYAQGSVQAGKRWPLTSTAERRDKWLPGGMQHLAIHSSSRRLFSLMHRGGPDSYKDPGSQIWVYDLATQRRTQCIELKEPATSIAVTSDTKPLLFSIFIGAPKVDVRDAQTGALLRSIAEIGLTPSTLVAY